MARTVLGMLALASVLGCSDPVRALDAARVEPDSTGVALDIGFVAQDGAQAPRDAAGRDEGVTMDAGTDSGAPDAGFALDAATACSGTCYVAPTGLDSNPGTTAAPFQTIGRCTRALGPGEACVVTAGTYRESVHVPSGVTVRARVVGTQPDPVVVTGLEDFSTGLMWTPQGSHLWVAAVDLMTTSSRLALDEQQVFLDDVPLIEARWPNIDGDVSRLLDRDGPGMAIAEAGSQMTDGIHGLIIDATQPASDLTGAVVHVAGGLNWAAHTGMVSASRPGGLDYVVDNFDASPIIEQLRTVPGNRYYLTRSRQLLDQPSEFYYDPLARLLYLWLNVGDHPNRHRLEAKMREWAFDLSAAQNAQLQNLKIRAASVKMDINSAHNELRGLDASYISHYLRNVGGPFSGRWNETGIRLWGTANTLRDSKIRTSAGNGVSLLGTGHTISNCIIAFTDYAGVYNSPIFITSDASGYTSGHQILGNTLGSTGRDSILFLATAAQNGAWSGGALSNSRIAFNDISDYGRLAVDLGGLYTCCNVDGATWSGGQVVSRSYIDHNAVHDGQGSGVFFDNMSHGFVVAHNLLWNNATSGVQLNGYPPVGDQGSNYDITINNNTFGPGQAQSISVQAQNAGGLSNTYISNNIFVTPPQARTGCTAGICAGQTNFGSGGFSNYYGDPGFVHGNSVPFDFSLGASAGALRGSATPVWTDDAPASDRCPGGISCAAPVAPTYGALSDDGYRWSFGSTL